LGGVAYEEHQYYDIETGAIDWTSPKLYVLMVANISVSLAFYGLLSFYHTTEKGEYFVMFSILKYHLDPIYVNLIMCCFYDQTWRGAIPGPSFCVSKELCS
jgi:hypothetical protein